MANEEYHITCIIGDLLERHLTISEPSLDIIDKIRFTCVGEGIYSYLPYSEEEGVWYLRFDKDVTSCFRPGTFIYDLTAILIDGNEYTLIYQGLLTAKAKVRPDEDTGEETEEECKRKKHRKKHRRHEPEDNEEEDDSEYSEEGTD